MPVITNNKYNGVEPRRITELLIADKISVGDLEPKNRNHVKAVLDFFTKMPSRMKELSTEVEYKFLYEVIKKDFTLFVNLDKKQYRDDIAQLFLMGVLKDPANKINRLAKNEINHDVYHSYDEKIAISYDYVTRKGDELYYFDNELKVPASLISKFKVIIRVEDNVEFVKMLDVSVRDFCAAIVYNRLYYIFNTSFRKVLFDMVTKEGVGYYKVTNSILDIERAAIEEINSRFFKGCAVVTSFAVKRIEVDREVRDKMESEFFELRKKRINIDEELKYQKDSMELLAKKLELLNKYSAPKDMLTEAEKDKAFDRYARKGRIVATEGLSNSQLEEVADDSIGNGIPEQEDKLTTEHKSGYFVARLVGGIIYGFTMFILIIALFAMGRWVAGLIGAGIASILYGLLLIITAVAEHKKGSTVILDDADLGNQ